MGTKVPLLTKNLFAADTWERKKIGFLQRSRLGISTPLLPGWAPCSGVVDQYKTDSMFHVWFLLLLMVAWLGFFFVLWVLVFLVGGVERK